LAGENIAGIDKETHVLAKTELNASTELSERLFHFIELMAGTAENIRRDSGVTDGKPPNQISRCAINEIVSRV
jgi:hypothetical protein